MLIQLALNDGRHHESNEKMKSEVQPSVVIFFNLSGKTFAVLVAVVKSCKRDEKDPGSRDFSTARIDVSFSGHGPVKEIETKSTESENIHQEHVSLLDHSIH